MKEYRLNDYHKITVEKAGNDYRVKFLELTGGRWEALGPAELYTPEALADEYGIITRDAIENEKTARLEYIKALGNECAFTDSWLDKINQMESDYKKERAPK